MGVMNGFSTETGERVFVYGADNAGFFEDAANTPAWKRYVKEFGATPENQARLGEILTQLHGRSEYIALTQFVDALVAGLDAGEFTRKVVEQPSETPVEETPLTRAGRPMTEPQQRWSEYRKFSETHSSRECRERARVDAGYASFMRKNLEREMGGVGDAVENLNARPDSPKTKVTDELKAFADQYHRLASDEVRRLSRASTNPYGYEQFNENLNAAIAAGLI